MSARARLAIVAGLLAVFAWVTVWLRFREASPEPPPPPPDLRAWDFLGCHQLEYGTWSGGTSAPPGQPPLHHVMLLPDSVDEWGRAQGTYRAVSLNQDAPSGTGSRTGADRGADPEVDVRWFTRADTLWLVWTEEESLGGIALRRTRYLGSNRTENRLEGRAVSRPRGRARRGGAQAGATGGESDRRTEAAVAAWSVNCHSLRAVPSGPVER